MRQQWNRQSLVGFSRLKRILFTYFRDQCVL